MEGAAHHPPPCPCCWRAAVSALEAIRRWWRGARRTRQGTCCYCPGNGKTCRNELVACGLSPFWHDAAGLVGYQCGKCGVESRWWFDVPVPVLISWDRPDRD